MNENIDQNKYFRFRDFPVYKDARKYRKELKQLSKEKFPKSEQYVLTQQLWKALDSIVLNIAEGSERYSDIDFSRFLNTSLTSVNEVVACLDCAIDVGYIDCKNHDYFLKHAKDLIKQLKAFCSYVRKSKNNNE